jgi:hypothetical protein
MDYPDDRDVLETFECDAPVSFRSAFFLGFPFHSAHLTLLPAATAIA